MASTKISYFGKKVYIGIDVHKETYSVTSFYDGLVVKKVASIPADPAQISQSILNWFKEAEIHTAYEAGFSGFGLHRGLEKAGIKSIVVNGASVARSFLLLPQEEHFLELGKNLPATTRLFPYIFDLYSSCLLSS